MKLRNILEGAYFGPPKTYRTVRFSVNGVARSVRNVDSGIPDEFIVRMNSIPGVEGADSDQGMAGTHREYPSFCLVGRDQDLLNRLMRAVSAVHDTKIGSNWGVDGTTEGGFHVISTIINDGKPETIVVLMKWWDDVLKALEMAS